jgi:hypothetical protein
LGLSLLEPLKIPSHASYTLCTLSSYYLLQHQQRKFTFFSVLLINCLEEV